MFGGDPLHSTQVCDGARHFQDPIVRPRRESHPPHGQLKCPLARFVERAQVSQCARGNMRIVVAPLVLDAASLLDTLPHFGRRSAAVVGSQVFVGHRWNLDVEVDAVEQRPAYLA
jgi:hypothetical protein